MRCLGSASALVTSSGSRSSKNARVPSQTSSAGRPRISFSSRRLSSAGIDSSESLAKYSSYSFLARAPNIVPRRSTWTFTPISNMSAAGAITTSPKATSASIAFPASQRPDSMAAWLMDPVRT